MICIVLLEAGKRIIQLFNKCFNGVRAENTLLIPACFLCLKKFLFYANTFFAR